MRFVHLFDQLKALAQFGADGAGVVTRHFESAALLRAIGGKRGDDAVAVRRQTLPQALPIFLPVGWVGQKMEDGTVMPKSKWTRRAKRRDGSLEPRDYFRAWFNAAPEISSTAPFSNPAASR